MIRAECHSDDMIVAVKFDATDWFSQAGKQEILDLVACGYGGDVPADDIAIHMESRHPFVKAVFGYINAAQLLRRDIGFEVHVHEDDAASWLRANRPDILSDMVAAGHYVANTSGNEVTPHWDQDSSWVGDYAIQPEAPSA